MSITAKSVIFDIADNWGNYYHVALRSVEFYLAGSLVAIGTYSAYAAGQYNATLVPALSFSATTSKTGNWSPNQWASRWGYYTNERLTLNLATAIEFDSIVVNNSHSSGGTTNGGVKNVVITVSTDDITSTVYNATITNPTVIFTGVIPEHIAADVVDNFTMSFEVAVDYRAILDQSYGLLNVLARAILEQDYSLTNKFIASLVQVYGLRILVVLHQLYGNSPQYRSSIEQFYGDAFFVRRLFAQDYGDASRYRAMFDQSWNLPEGLRQINVQRYGIAEHKLMAFCDQLYDLSDMDLLRAQLHQLYVLAAGEALVQRTDQSVVCDGVIHASAYNIFIEQDESLFYMVGELQLADELEYLQYVAYETEVVITVDGESYAFIVDGYPRKSRVPGNNSFVVPLASPTILLDSPLSKLKAGDFVGMASVLVAELAAPYAIDWQLVDWHIPAGILTTDGESAISIIKKIVVAAGGLVQTSPAGTLICRPEYPVSVNVWETATPDIELTDQDDFFQITPGVSIREGYNIFYLSDQSLAADSVNMEVTTLSSSEVLIDVYQQPWDDTVGFNMLHSGGSWVSVVANGVSYGGITEQVEIIGGSGQTSKPVMAYLAHEYSENDLGEVTIDEAGNVTTEIGGNTLIQLTYKRRCWSFLATDNNIEDVQFYPEEVAL